MKFEEYLEFLIDIRIKLRKHKTRVIYLHPSMIGDSTKSFIKEIDVVLQTPSNKLKSKDWFDVGYILGQYFGKKACKIVYGKSFEEMIKNGNKHP